MGRPLRFMPGDSSTFEITTRCIQGRLLLRPSKKLNEIVLGVIGRALSLYPVLLHLVIVASNHIHLLVTVTSCKMLADFMRYVNGNLAREAGRLHGWREKLWGRRYRAIAVLDDESLIRRVRYFLSHGCKEGLVMHPADWPGINCLEALVKGRMLAGVWYDRTKEYEARRAGDPRPDAFVTRYEVPLAPLPFLVDKRPEQRVEWFRALVEDIERETRDRLRKEGRAVLGVTALLHQHPHQHPEKVKRSSAPLCHCSDREKRIEYRDAYRWFASLYQAASRLLRSGELNVQFPNNCFPPALAFCGTSPAPP